VCAAVEGACVRRMGRRVRISQEGVLAVFGLDMWRSISASTRIVKHELALLSIQAVLSASDAAAALYVLSRKLGIEMQVTCSIHVGSV